MSAAVDTAGRLVSIVMPAYNAAATIAESIDSARRQTYPHWELLVVDDGSTDATREIVATFLADSRIRLIQGPGRGGAANARNIGLDAARGDYVAFLDSDDLWVEDKLERQVAFMRSTGCKLSYGAYWRFAGSDQEPLSLVTPPSHVTYATLLKSNPIGCLTALYDRRVFPSMRMPDMAALAKGTWLHRWLSGRVGHEDYAFWLAMLRSNEARSHGFARGIAEPLAKYRVSPGSLSSNKARAAAFQWLVYRRAERLPLWRAALNFVVYAWRGVRKSRGDA